MSDINTCYREYFKDDHLIIEMIFKHFNFSALSNVLAKLRNLITENNYSNIIFDFRNVFLIDSSVFGFLIEIRNSLQKKGKEVVIVCDNSDLLKIMKMLNVSKLIHITETVYDAVEYLKHK